eukprot:12500858-Alexandrium_andersonii.AAC.1
MAVSCASSLILRTSLLTGICTVVPRGESGSLGAGFMSTLPMTDPGLTAAESPNSVACELGLLGLEGVNPPSGR